MSDDDLGRKIDNAFILVRILIVLGVLLGILAVVYFGGKL